MADAFSVSFSPGAEADMIAIATYLLDHRDADAARIFATTIRQKVAALADFPHRGAIPRELDDGSEDGFRQILSGRYRIVYQVEASKVVIVLVADGRRDMQALLRVRLLAPRSI